VKGEGERVGLEVELTSVLQQAKQESPRARATLQQRASETLRENTGFETDPKELDGFDCRSKCDPQMTGKGRASSERIALSNVELDAEGSSLQLGKECRGMRLPRSASKLENPEANSVGFSPGLQ
jgi:hypothetical protein